MSIDWEFQIKHMNLILPRRDGEAQKTGLRLQAPELATHFPYQTPLLFRRGSILRQSQEILQIDLIVFLVFGTVQEHLL